MDEIYLDNIDEYVNDHDKIVTYKWLSLTLGVHVNTAKQMLFHYLDHKRKESSAQLHATYLVSGKFVDNGLKSHKVSLVREDQLENVKSKMSPVVSVHIYSVQKALLKDSGPLYSVDYDAVKDNMKNCSRYSAIRCSSAVPLSPVEMQREIQRDPTPEPDVKKSSVNGNAAAKVSSKPQKGIMGMFGTKPASKNQDESKDVKSEVKENTPVVEDKPAAKTSHMKNFFGNQTKKADKTVKEEEVARPPAADPKPQKEEKPPREPVAAAEPPKQTKKDSRSKSKRVQDSDSEEEKTEKKNKRRRIKKPVSDSSDEDVIPDSPQPTETRGSTPSPKKQIQPITQSNVNSEGKIRRRRRVLKAKTFVDDEGCIVTEKAYESESYSEEDAPAPAVRTTALSSRPSGRDPEKKNQKKIAANKGGKQASIMGFFQKK